MVFITKIIKYTEIQKKGIARIIDLTNLMKTYSFIYSLILQNHKNGYYQLETLMFSL